MTIYQRTRNTTTGEVDGIRGTEPGCTFVFNPESNSLRAIAYRQWLEEGNEPLPAD